MDIPKSIPMDLSGTMLSSQAMIEWHCWKAVCAELKRLGIDINEQDELTRLIRFWGKRYHEYQLDLHK